MQTEKEKLFEEFSEALRLGCSVSATAQIAKKILHKLGKEDFDRAVNMAATYPNGREVA